MTSEELLQMAMDTINALTASLETASAALNRQTELVRILSEQNLALASRLDSLTGKKSPSELPLNLA